MFYSRDTEENKIELLTIPMGISGINKEKLLPLASGLVTDTGQIPGWQVHFLDEL